jgi:hypothetical protein
LDTRVREHLDEENRLTNIPVSRIINSWCLEGNSGEPLDEGMTSNVAKMIAIGLKKRCISLGNQVESATDVGEKINNLSKQLNAVAAIALVAVSMSDEGLLSKGMILTSLLSSNEPDEDLDTLFEDLC